MEGGGERPGACSPPPPPAAPSSPPPLPVESQVEIVLEAAAAPPPRPPMEGEVAETASESPDGGESVEPPVHLPSQGAEPGEASGTRDRAVSEEGAAALLPLLLDEEEAKEATLEALDGGMRSQEAAAAAPVLTDDLREKIVRQVQYYFSDENLPTDKFLLKYVKKDREGFVPIAVIASFRRMRKLVQDDALIVTALRTSSQLVISLDGKKVKRLHVLPATEVEDSKPRTVLVENLPEDCSRDGIQKIFGSIGNIRRIYIRDPHIKGGSGINNKEEMMISSKVHALVEYETTEAAENAVVTLNDEKNWRSGMRVELLLKRMEKFGIIPRVRKGASEKSSDVHASEADRKEQNVELLDHPEEMNDQEEGKHLSGGKIGQKVRNKRRGKSSEQHTGNGHGHGHVPSGSSIEGPRKPPRGPRMPDGTRGFTMGRGKPCLPSSN